MNDFPFYPHCAGPLCPRVRRRRHASGRHNGDRPKAGAGPGGSSLFGGLAGCRATANVSGATARRARPATRFIATGSPLSAAARL